LFFFSDILPVTVVGDLHGQLVDLRKIIERCGSPAKNTYVFLGDYVDRGTQVYLALINAFNHLPLCAMIGGRVLCMHGGLSPFIESLDDIEQPGWSLSCRGISFSFDETVVEQFCQKHGIDLIVRAHQITGDMVRGGHRIFAGGRLVTIFSAPNYQNMLNDGCVLRVKKNDKNVGFIELLEQKNSKLSGISHSAMLPILLIIGSL
uniref:SER_THR_PHOSPHATASE domain-containing protein n=1 Tax=Nippostrongylus brasiliensis TaxID=27835 RepID=A0A0N4YYU1_NIPBR